MFRIKLSDSKSLDRESGYFHESRPVTVESSNFKGSHSSYYEDEEFRMLKDKLREERKQQNQIAKEVIQKVLEERQAKHLSKFKNRSRKSTEKYQFLEKIEEKSFVRLKPSQQAKEELSPDRAKEVFDSYNREREFMSRSRSGSPYKNILNLDLQTKSPSKKTSPEQDSEIVNTQISPEKRYMGKTKEEFKIQPKLENRDTGGSRRGYSNLSNLAGKSKNRESLDSSKQRNQSTPPKQVRWETPLTNNKNQISNAQILKASNTRKSEQQNLSSERKSLIEADNQVRMRPSDIFSKGKKSNNSKSVESNKGKDKQRDSAHRYSNPFINEVRGSFEKQPSKKKDSANKDLMVVNQRDSVSPFKFDPVLNNTPLKSTSFLKNASMNQKANASDISKSKPIQKKEKETSFNSKNIVTQNSLLQSNQAKNTSLIKESLNRSQSKPEAVNKPRKSNSKGSTKNKGLELPQQTFDRELEKFELLRQNSQERFLKEKSLLELDSKILKKGEKEKQFNKTQNFRLVQAESPKSLEKEQKKLNQKLQSSSSIKELRNSQSKYTPIKTQTKILNESSSFSEKKFQTLFQRNQNGLKQHSSSNDKLQSQDFLAMSLQANKDKKFQQVLKQNNKEVSRSDVQNLVGSSSFSHSSYPKQIEVKAQNLKGGKMRKNSLNKIQKEFMSTNTEQIKQLSQLNESRSFKPQHTQEQPAKNFPSQPAGEKSSSKQKQNPSQKKCETCSTIEQYKYHYITLDDSNQEISKKPKHNKTKSREKLQVNNPSIDNKKQMAGEGHRSMRDDMLKQILHEKKSRENKQQVNDQVTTNFHKQNEEQITIQEFKILKLTNPKSNQVKERKNEVVNTARQKGKSQLELTKENEVIKNVEKEKQNQKGSLISSRSIDKSRNEKPTDQQDLKKKLNHEKKLSQVQPQFTSTQVLNGSKTNLSLIEYKNQKQLSKFETEQRAFEPLSKSKSSSSLQQPVLQRKKQESLQLGMSKIQSLIHEDEPDFTLSTKGSSSNLKQQYYHDKKSADSKERQRHLKSIKKQYSIDMSSKRKQQKHKHTVTFQSIVDENLIYDNEAPSILEVQPHEDSYSSKYMQQQLSMIKEFQSRSSRKGAGEQNKDSSLHRSTEASLQKRREKFFYGKDSDKKHYKSRSQTKEGDGDSKNNISIVKYLQSPEFKEGMKSSASSIFKQ